MVESGATCGLAKAERCTKVMYRRLVRQEPSFSAVIADIRTHLHLGPTPIFIAPVELKLNSDKQVKYIVQETATRDIDGYVIVTISHLNNNNIHPGYYTAQSSYT